LVSGEKKEGTQGEKLFHLRQPDILVSNAENENHGFASLPRDRFAFIVRYLQKNDAVKAHLSGTRAAINIIYKCELVLLQLSFIRAK
jgi:hypothetical protein